MRRRGKGWSFWIALVAVQALLLHAAIGLTSPSHAGVPQLDAFGNVICAPSVGQSPVEGDHHSAPECCALGCAFASPMPAPSGVGVAIAVERPVFIDLSFDATTALSPVAADHDPGHPRAPPRGV